MIIIEHDKEPEYASTLLNVKSPIADRMTSLFCLRTIGNESAVDTLCQALNEEPSSDLLRHEICYCLG